MARLPRYGPAAGSPANATTRAAKAEVKSVEIESVANTNSQAAETGPVAAKPAEKLNHKAQAADGQAIGNSMGPATNVDPRVVSQGCG